VNVGAVERKIARVENFCVRIKYLDGTDVRSDRDQMPTYPYENAARDAWTVTHWKRERFKMTYPGFEVDVLKGNLEAASGRTQLETVRNSYTA
jgi:hypothetical protein